MQYDVHQAKSQLSRLLEMAHQGEEIIIAKDGRPYAAWSHWKANLGESSVSARQLQR